MYIGALDQGTTSTRFMIFDHAGTVVAVAQEEHEQIFPHPGWVEHNPEEVRTRTFAVIEAGLACGMTRSHLFLRIVFPQALRYALPGLSNLWLINLKSTALLSVTGLVELTRQANIAAGSTYKFLFFYTVAAAIYAVLSFLSTVIIKRIEIWSNRGTLSVAG